MAEVSIIIPTYNRSGSLKRAVDSILEQTYKDFEIIIVDDGSTDETGKIASGYGKTVNYITQINSGPSRARNRGIEESKGRFIAFLDSDDYWYKNKLASQVAFFKENPQAMVCQTEEIWIRNGRRVNPMNKHKKYSGMIFEKCLPLCVVSPSAVMLKRGIFDEIGLFDENLIVCEDYDLWLRVSFKYPIYLIDKPLVIKTGGHDDQLSRQFWGMDKHRIYAIEKILRGGCLSDSQKRSAVKELKKKCRIYGKGCIKHGRTEEGNDYLNLAEKYAKL